jgi:hypothetical protein
MNLTANAVTNSRTTTLCFEHNSSKYQWPFRATQFGVISSRVNTKDGEEQQQQKSTTTLPKTLQSTSKLSDFHS